MQTRAKPNRNPMGWCPSGRSARSREMTGLRRLRLSGRFGLRALIAYVFALMPSAPLRAERNDQADKASLR